MSNRSARKNRVWEKQRQRQQFDPDIFMDGEFELLLEYLEALDSDKEFEGDKMELCQIWFKLTDYCPKGRVISFSVGRYEVRVEGSLINLSKPLGWLSCMK